MASLKLAPTLVFTILLAFACSVAFATFPQNQKCCQCQNYNIVGNSQFIIGQNEIDLAGPNLRSFNAPFQVTSSNINLPNCNYIGIIARTPGPPPPNGFFLTSEIVCGNDRVEFQGDAGQDAPGSTTVYGVTGGTGRFVGATGTATEVGQGNNRYQVTLNIKVCDNGCCSVTN